MTLLKKRLVQIYSSGKSMADIAKEYHCSINTIVYWMKKYNIQRRSHSEATYLKENPNGDPFIIKTRLNRNEQVLFGLALGLFWGEGTKATKHSVRITNTDPAMIRLFRSFLLHICGVPSQKIRYSLVTFNDTHPKSAQTYWAKELEISDDKFGTIVSIRPQGKGTYKRKSLYGVCSITVSNVKLKTWIMSKLEEVKHARLV